MKYLKETIKRLQKRIEFLETEQETLKTMKENKTFPFTFLEILDQEAEIKRREKLLKESLTEIKNIEL